MFVLFLFVVECLALIRHLVAPKPLPLLWNRLFKFYRVFDVHVVVFRFATIGWMWWVSHHYGLSPLGEIIIYVLYAIGAGALITGSPQGYVYDPKAGWVKIEEFEDLLEVLKNHFKD